MQTKLPVTRKPQRKRGTTTVEFAVVLPLIFTLFLGSIEITRLNFIRHSAANAAYEAARKGIVPGNTTTDAQNEGSRLLQILGVNNGATVVATRTSDRISVTVTIPTRLNSWGLSQFTGGINVIQSCSLTCEAVR